MNQIICSARRRMLWVARAAAVLGLWALIPYKVHAQIVVTSDLQRPAKIIQTPLRNVLVAEVGTAAAAPNTGRVSIADRDGHRRTLVDGLPSAPTNAANTPSGPSGLFLRGRTLFVVIGEGDVTLAGPFPRTEIPNPMPSSPLFSSVLAVHFSARSEMNTTGVTLTVDDHHTLKAGGQVLRSDTKGHTIKIELVADFADFLSEPLPTFAGNVRHSHPYGVVADDGCVYVVDGGYNVVHKVDIGSGQSSILTSFPRTPNPGTFGPPLIENVPTSIRWDGDRLIVTLLSGFPFIAGLSQVRAIDPDSGDHVALIADLASAIDVIPVTNHGETTGYLTLEYSVAHLAGGPGRLRFFDASGAASALLAGDLITPSSMLYDSRSGSVLVSEISTGTLKNFTLPE